MNRARQLRDAIHDLATEDDTQPNLRTSKRPDRAGRKSISVYVPPDLWRRLRQAAFNQDTTLQSVCEQILSDGISRYDTKG